VSDGAAAEGTGGRVAAREGTMEEAQKHWWQVKYWWYKIQRLLGRGGL
jgi:hypothetical protein